VQIFDFKISEVSYNQPKLCSNTTWNPNGTTLANISIVGSGSYALYIDNHNTIYTVNPQKNHILIWKNGNINPSTVLYSNLSSPLSIFVTSNGDIYVGDNSSIKHISYSNSSRLIMQVSSLYMGLFIDITNSIYCSIDQKHQVFKKWLGDNASVMATVAGNGSAGSASNQLYNPNGIFVDTNFNLYIADWRNNRIQLFRLGQSNGITVAGNTSLKPTIILKSPSNVILDGNKYLFITDSFNHRIIGSDEYGFRCIVGCTGSEGSNSNQLSIPRSIAFDSVGNLYVIEFGNNRIQKFLLTSSCCKYIVKSKHIHFISQKISNIYSVYLSITASSHIKMR